MPIRFLDSLPDPAEGWAWDEIAHRPYPLPSGPWIMEQRWHDLLFMHWPVKPDVVRDRLPAALAPYLDLHQGQAWIGLVPFWMSHVGWRALPPLPRFAELNLRTYLTIGGRPGVYFFSLDAENLAAVWGARASFRLQYFHAQITVTHSGEQIDYRSTRRRAASAAEYAATYGPVTSEAFNALPGTLEHFLLERYCLYTCRRRTIRRGEIHHRPWPLQRAWCETNVNSIARAAGIPLPDCAPLLHYARRMRVAVWWPRKVQVAGNDGDTEFTEKKTENIDW